MARATRDLAFNKINPEARSSILDRLNYLNKKDENLIEDITTELKDLFSYEKIDTEIIGRLKNTIFNME